MLSIYLLLHTNINAFSIYNNCLFLVYVFILFSLVVLVVVLENHYFLVDFSVLQLTVTFLLCLQSGKKRVCVRAHLHHRPLQHDVRLLGDVLL